MAGPVMLMHEKAVDSSSLENWRKEKQNSKSLNKDWDKTNFGMYKFVLVVTTAPCLTVFHSSPFFSQNQPVLYKAMLMQF